MLLSLSLSRFVLAVVCVGSFAAPGFAQDSTPGPAFAPVVPHWVRYSGVWPEAPSGVSLVTARFAVYAQKTGGEPLWAEEQQVTLGDSGSYSVLLGSVTELTDTVFASGEARWVGVTVAGSEESVRTPLTASAYALKAEDAQTLGGHPVSDFALITGLKAKPDAATAVTQINTSNGILGGGTGPTVSLQVDPNYLETLGNSLYAQKTAVVSSLTGSSGVIVSHSGTAYTAIADTGFLVNLGNTVYAQFAAANTYKANQTLGAAGTATTSAGFGSYAERFAASVYNTRWARCSRSLSAGRRSPSGMTLPAPRPA